MERKQPSVQIETTLGTVSLMFEGMTRVRVHSGTLGRMRTSEGCLTWNAKPYQVEAMLEIHPDGQWGIKLTDKGNESTAALSIFDRTAIYHTTSAPIWRGIRNALVEACIVYIKANPELCREAELYRLESEMRACSYTLERLEKEKAHNEAKLAKLRAQALKLEKVNACPTCGLALLANGLCPDTFCPKGRYDQSGRG